MSSVNVSLEYSGVKLAYNIKHMKYTMPSMRNNSFNSTHQKFWTAGVGFDLQIKTLPKLSPQQHAMNRRKQKQSGVQCTADTAP
mgnify:CR=1 FL=1